MSSSTNESEIVEESGLIEENLNDDQERLLPETSTTTTTTTTTSSQFNEEEEEEESLEDYAGVVVTILQPVAITMLLVVWVVRTINISIDSGPSRATMVYQEDSTDSTSTKFFGSLLNALAFLGIILGTTVLFVILYKYRCLKVIYTWLMVSTCLLLGMFGGYMLYEILYSLGLALDWLTFSIIMWNFSVVGILAIFWFSPPKINQGYLIIISGLLAIYFTRLPDWTTWAILAIVAVYDLFAVLCPRGPLKVLVETAQERKEPIPALLYNASVVMMNLSDVTNETETETEATPRNLEAQNVNLNDPLQEPEGETTEHIEPRGNPPPQNEPPRQEEKRGVKLGLGDFVFYSVLMGRAALFDMITVFTCFVGIITGLFLTLLLLAIFRKALPALPISIALGIVFYFLTRGLLMPFAFTLGVDGVFV
eukprot:TRINITY_DN1830_c0_g1_i1.p1 TRINITY_DN1830_c0_g1~~TRINITY_DN1830_c0_g1_i1.p1  ORF type:complete len:424 (+),score=89.41 TRINITY_DN1830_c0_g1_i1:172-1443(+)